VLDKVSFALIVTIINTVKFGAIALVN